MITVATGTAGAQAITMAFAPFITRLYGPEAYGVMGVFMSTTAIFTPVAALTYPIAIVIPKNDSDAKSIAKLSAAISIYIGLLLLFFFTTFGEQIAKLFHIEVIYDFLVFIPIYIILSAWTQVIRQWLIRKKQYKITANVTFKQAAIVSASKAALGSYYPTSVTLILLSVLGIALEILQFMAAMQKKTVARITQNRKHVQVDIKLKEIAYQYRDFPLFRAPQVFINSASQSLPLILLSSFFGPASAGFYSISRTLLGMPTTLLGNSVSDVFYPRITEAFNEGKDVRKILTKATLYLALVSIPPFSIIILFGPIIFATIFGNEWAIAGEYARWMALWSMFGFMNRPSVSMIPLLGIQGQFLIFEIFSLLTRTIALFVGFYTFNSDTLSVMLYSITSAALNLILITHTISYTKKYTRNSTH